MAESSPRNSPRMNPFWTYRDPLSGRWLTLMTSMQCERLTQTVFVPKIRTSQPTETNALDPDQPDVSA